MRRSTLITGMIAFLAMAIMPAIPARAADTPHNIVVQVDSPKKIDLALNNVANIYHYYADQKQRVNIEVVAYGPGLVMLLKGKSKAEPRIRALKEEGHGHIVFSACDNTLKAMEHETGHRLTIIPEARLVPSGAVRITELEAQGWSYLRP
jgi:intracellular sulfur oxidation DsrE/DsrF family protein